MDIPFSLLKDIKQEKKIILYILMLLQTMDLFPIYAVSFS